MSDSTGTTKVSWLTTCGHEGCDRTANFGYLSNLCTVHTILTMAAALSADDVARVREGIAAITPLTAEEIEERRVTSQLWQVSYAAEQLARARRNAADRGATDDQITQALATHTEGA